jgi:ABC-type sugar transport system ATPase subunit
MPRFCSGIVVNESKKLKNFVYFSEQVSLNIRDPGHLTKNLSGGNQQKVILAKWLSSDVQILIFDEPTKGVDVGAKTEIYRLMEEFVAQGKSIILVSSEMPEIIGMCDRVVVMKSGQITAMLEHEDMNEETILSYAMEGKRT